MQYRIIAMRLNRASAMPGMEVTSATTATLDLEPIAAAGVPATHTSVIVDDWSGYVLDQVYDLTPTPIAS